MVVATSTLAARGDDIRPNRRSPIQNRCSPASQRPLSTRRSSPDQPDRVAHRRSVGQAAITRIREAMSNTDERSCETMITRWCWALSLAKDLLDPFGLRNPESGSGLVEQDDALSRFFDPGRCTRLSPLLGVDRRTAFPPGDVASRTRHRAGRAGPEHWYGASRGC